MYIVFIKDKNKMIYRKIATEDKETAIKHFEETIYRKELYGRKLIAIFMKKETIKAFHRFDVPTCACRLQEEIKKIKGSM